MAEEAAESSKRISLKTFDGDIFEVSPAIVKEMQTVQSFIDEGSTSVPFLVPLPNVHTRELSRIIDYCSQHHSFRDADGSSSSAGASSRSDEAKAYDAAFVKELSHGDLKELLLAANYLNVKDLLDFLSQSIADLIRNKRVEFVRKFFGIVSDHTPEEEAEIREKYAWAFEGVDEDLN